jgi:hypothetical protein
VSEKNILRHTCRSKGGMQYALDELEPNYFYFQVGENPDRFCRLPEKCKCRKRISIEEAQEAFQSGRAQWLCKIKDGRPIILNGVSEKEVENLKHAVGLCEAIAVWVVKFRVARVHKISAADMVRSVTVFGKLNKGTDIDQRIQKRYQKYIQEVHKVAMEARALLFRGIILENGKQVGGSPEFLDVEAEQRGRPLFWWDSGRSK